MSFLVIRRQRVYMANLLQIKLWEVLQETGPKNMTKILKNTCKG